MMPRIRSPTSAREFTSRNMVEDPEAAPPRRHAFSLTGKEVSSVNRPSSRASKTMSAVISFDMLAGGIGSSPFLENSTSPLS